jgi:nucleotide-binding universal stress UspA family protein
MVFVVAGLVASWTGVVDLGSATHVEPETTREAVFLVVELALVLLLFTDAAQIDVRHSPGVAFKRIGVAYDDGPEARDALEAAVALARAGGRCDGDDVHGARARRAGARVDDAGLAAAAGIPRRPPPARRGGGAVRARPDPRRAARRSRAVERGAASLLAEVSSGLDLIACGSRGYGPLRAVLLGAVSTRLARTAACPLLVTPRGHGVTCRARTRCARPAGVA